jgi:chromosome partitioning protein
MGQIIIIGGNKGGSAKTATCIQLAVQLAHIGADFLVVNADPQKSMANFVRYRQQHGVTPAIPLAEAYGDISTQLHTHAKKYDIVLVDVAGRNSAELVTGLLVADQVIAPHQSTQVDLDTLEELATQVRVARMRGNNPDLRARAYQTITSTHRHKGPIERQEFLTFVKEFPELEAMESASNYRSVYRSSFGEGKGVTECDDEKAAAEAVALFNEVFPQWS